MKLKRLFCYKYFCFLFFLIFAGGVGFAKSGMLNPSSDVKIIWTGGTDSVYWKYENGDPVEWKNEDGEIICDDTTGEVYTGHIYENMILKTDGGKITVSLESDLNWAISNLFIFGENECVFELNGHNINIGNLLLGSSYDYYDIDGKFIANSGDDTSEEKKSGNITINGGEGDKGEFIVNGNIDTSSKIANDECSKISLINVKLQVKSTWQLGSEENEAKLPEISGTNSNIEINIIQSSDLETGEFIENFKEKVNNSDTPDVQPYIWYGSSSSAWNNPANWSTGEIPPEGENVTIETKDVGNGGYDPVLSSEISLNSIVFNTCSTLTIASGGSLKIDPNNLSGDYSILIESGGSFISSSANDFTIGSNFKSSSKGTIKTENSNCAITINTNFDGPINFDCVGNITLEANNKVNFGTVNANTFTNKGTAIVNTKLTSGTVTNNGTLTINGQVETGNLKNNSIVTITDENELLISKKIDNSNGIIAGSVKLSGNNISSDSMHLGNDTSEYKNLTIDTYNEISFAGNPKINNLIVLNANGVTFTDSVTIYNVNDVAYSGDFTFYSANFGTSNIEFKTSGILTFESNENSTTSFEKDLTHTNGTTVINGTFSAGSNNLSLGETTINGSVTVKDIKTQTTTINGSVSAENAEFGDTTINGKAIITGNIKSSKVIISNNGTLEINKNLENVDSITVNGTLISNIGSDFTIGDNFVSDSKGTIQTKNENSKVIVDTDFIGPINFDCKGNLIINEEKTVVSGTVKAKNVKNNGTLTINGDIEATSVEILSGTLSIDGDKLASDNVNAIFISESATLISMNSFTIGSNFKSSSTGTIKTENSDYEITINTSFIGPINFECKGNLIINEGKTVVSGTVNAKNVTNNGTLTINRQAEIKNFFNNSSTVIANNIIVIITKQFTNNGSFTGNLKLSGSEIVSDIKLAAEGNESVFKILEIDSDGKEFSFTGSPKIEKLKVVSAKSVNFYDNPNCIISEIEESNSNSTNYYFNKVKFANISDLGTSSDKIEFSTSGRVRFKECESSKNIKINNTNNEVYIESSFKGKDIECGKTTIEGTVTGEKIKITEATINGSIEGSEITVEKTELDGSITGTEIKIGDASLKGTVTGTEVSIGTAELNGNIIGENINIGATEILGNSELKISESSTNGKIILNGDVSSTESKNLTLNGNVECNCSQINLTEGTLTAKGTFVAKKDLEITAKSTFEKTVNAEKSLFITGDSIFKQDVSVLNILKLQGNVELKGNLVITQDDGYLLFNGNKKQIVKLNENDTYKKIVVEKDGGILEICNNVKIENFENKTKENTIFIDTITIKKIKNIEGNAEYKGLSKITYFENQKGNSIFKKDAEITTIKNNDNLQFKSKLTANETVENSGSITIADVAEITTLKNIGEKSEIEFNQTGTVESAENSGKIIINEDLSVKNIVNNGVITIAENKELLVSENFEDNNRIDGQGLIKLNGTENQEINLNENNLYKKIVVEKESGEVSIETEAKIETFENIKGITVFKKSTIITTVTNNAGTVKIDDETKITTLENSKNVELNGRATINTLKNIAENAIVAVNAGADFGLIENNGEIQINENSSTKSLKNNKKIQIAEGKVLTILENIEDTGEIEGTGAIRFTGNEEQRVSLKENGIYPHIIVEKKGGKITFTNQMAIEDFEIIKSPETIFENKVNFTKLEIQNGTKNIFKNDIEATTIEITEATETKFETNVKIESFTDTENSGSYLFSKQVYFDTATTFNTIGEVTFGTEESSKTMFGTSDNSVDFTHTAGKTKIVGTFVSNNLKLAETMITGDVKGKDIECGKTTIDGTVTGEKIDFTETTINGSLEGTEITVGKTVLDGSIKGTVIKIGDASLKGTVTGTEVSIETAELNGNIIGEKITIGEIKILEDSELNSSTDGKITLNGDVSSTESKNLTLNGNVECNCSKINLKEGTLTAKGTFVAKKDLEITAKSTFEKTVNAENNLIIIGESVFGDDVDVKKSLKITGNVVFEKNVNTTNNIYINNEVPISTQNIEIFGDVNVGNDLKFWGQTITFAKKTTVNQNVEIQNTGLLKILDFTYGKSFVQKGNGQVMISGSFEHIDSLSAEKGVAEFTTLNTESDFSNVYLYNETQNQNENQNTTVFGSDNSSISIKGNLIVAKAKENTISVKGSVKSNNFVLYSGNIELSGDIFTSGDVILLGENYSLKDNQTGIQNLYSYNENRPANWSQASYSFEKNIPDVTQENPNGTKLPDGTESNRFKGTLKVASGKSITVGKNFYANGTELSLLENQGSGKWNLFIPENSNAETSFCEAYNSTVSDCFVECFDLNLRGQKESKISALQCTDNGGNENWAFDDVKITKAYSVSDKVIRVEFNVPVRIQKKYKQQSQLRFSNSPDENHLFEAVYLNEDCSKEATIQGDYYIVAQNYSNEENQTYYYCYFKANSTWNTDATGKSAGNSEKSTDYEANHKDTNICLDFPRAIQNGSAINSFVITDAWGTRLKNYSLRTTNGDTKIPYGHNDDLENAVEDKTGPVLISVKTGQENHTEYDSSKGAESQPSYDAHNFIEFLYSEPVNFGSENVEDCSIWLKSDEKVENVQVTQKFGALQNEDITQSGELKIAGLAKIQNGKIYTGSQGNVDKYVNALYRFDEYSLRYSIAGFTDKTQTVKDREGFEHKKWIGYIEEAEIPSGDVSMITEGKNPLVSDLKGNAQTLVKKELVVDSAENGVYGKWDISSPMFAPFNNNTIQVNPLYVEAIGNNNGFGSTLDRIEFHLFDNTVKLDSSDEAVWLTEFGWCKNDGSASLILPDSYCADVFGGSRTFAANVQNRTGGGIRYSSLENAVKAFKYTSDFDIEPSIKFDETENVYTTVNARLFTGSSDFFRPANKTDGLYFALALTDKTLDVKSTFKISYNDKDGFITDLAGNRLKSVTFSTIDRMPPSISVVLSPINQKDFYVVFLKKVALKGMKLYDNDGTKIDVSESLLDLLPQCFEFIQINDDGSYSIYSDLQIDTNIAAQEIDILNKEEYSMYKMSFVREVSFDDVKNLYCRIKNPQKYDFLMCDPITNIKDSSVTLIQDELGNYINMYETHVLSDVAINGINPLYGYNSSVRGENVKEDSENLNYVVRDWNEDQKNYGTFKHNEEIAIVCDVDFNSIEKNQFNHNVQMFFNNDSENKYLAEKFNSEIGGNLRVWFPNIMEKPFSFFSLNKNNNFDSVISTRIDKNDISKGIKFDILKESVQKWKSGDQISFLFSYLNDDNSQYLVYPAPVFDTKADKYKLSESLTYPLFVLRLKDKNDITSLDLWSFKVKSVTDQRGGVTILNNVINATYGEKTIVKLNVPQAGNVDVMVMTLDGNIVTYLQHGAISAGEYYFTWDGKNNSGQKVARGLYFVRVIGQNLDETRKVMVVKD